MAFTSLSTKTSHSRLPIWSNARAALLEDQLEFLTLNWSLGKLGVDCIQKLKWLCFMISLTKLDQVICACQHRKGLSTSSGNVGCMILVY